MQVLFLLCMTGNLRIICLVDWSPICSFKGFFYGLLFAPHPLLVKESGLMTDRAEGCVLSALADM